MFKLLIECSKDISELSINFTDGTSVVTSPESPPIPPIPPTRTESKKTQFKSAKEELLDLDTEFGTGQSTAQSAVVNKPDIKETDRTPKVAHELQNLDI